jgi:hypothetical protein
MILPMLPRKRCFWFETLISSAFTAALSAFWITGRLSEEGDTNRGYPISMYLHEWLVIILFLSVSHSKIHLNCNYYLS